MAFEWKHYLDIAGFLKKQLEAGDIEHEAAVRTAVGRAYFAAFGHAHKYAVAWLKFKGKSKPEEKSQEHGALRAYLRLKKRRKVAECLEDLRKWRNECDYHEEVSVDNWLIVLEAALANAEYVFQALTPPAGVVNGEGA